MDLKAHAQYSLNKARSLTERIIDGFRTDNDWFFQAHPKANHPLWIVGHLGLADNLFVSRFRESLGTKPEGWDELFWFGSEVKSIRRLYPDRGQVLDYLRDRRKTLWAVVDDLTPAELEAPAPPADSRSPIAGAPCMGHLLLFAAYHEGVHSGQLTVAHRGLGHPPLFGS